jgi:hypothetical protein
MSTPAGAHVSSAVVRMSPAPQHAYRLQAQIRRAVPRACAPVGWGIKLTTSTRSVFLIETRTTITFFWSSVRDRRTISVRKNGPTRGANLMTGLTDRAR